MEAMSFRVGVSWKCNGFDAWRKALRNLNRFLKRGLSSAICRERNSATPPVSACALPIPCSIPAAFALEHTETTFSCGGTPSRTTLNEADV